MDELLGHAMTTVNIYRCPRSGRLQCFVVLLASLFQLLSIHPARIIFEMSFDAVTHKSRCLTVVKRTWNIYERAMPNHAAIHTVAILDSS